MSEERYILRQNPLYQAAAGSAIVSFVFLAFVLAMVLYHLYALKVIDPRRTEKLTQMRDAYQSNPDQKLAEQIRAFDVRLRRDQLARMPFLHNGVILLVIFGAIFVVMLIWMRSFKPDVPQFKPLEDRSAQQVQQAFRVRTAVTLVLVAMGGAGLYYSLKSPAIFTGQTAADDQQQESAPTTFATMEEHRLNWSSFRGFGGLGICPFENIPTEWDGPSNKNILWRSAVPLPGHNSPVVWANRIFLTGASQEKQQMFCFDTEAGKLLWTGEIAVSPGRDEMDIMEDTGYAAPTAAVNGTYAAAIFADGQVGCFDFDGNLKWTKAVGVPDSMYGYASSLAVYENLLIIQMDQGYDPGESKLIAIDFATGRQVWQTERPVPNSWTSPTVVQVGNAWQILTSGAPWVIGYNPADGKEVWRGDCIDGDVAPTQVAADGKVFAIEPYDKLAAIAAAGASGDITESGIAWQADGDMPDICSPITDGKLVWTLTTNGGLGCYDAGDGTQVYEQDLDGMFQASPSLVNGSLYLLSTKGKMLRIAAGRTFEKLGECELGEEIFASPAFAAGRIFIRR